MAKGGKILVAEDDAEARELLMLSLADGDYDLLQAADGIEALHLLRTEHPDLLITDIVMPRMDGYELVRKLRQDETMSSTPVIFCSASYHEREVREMARSLGVRSTLSKPYDLEVVRETVTAALATKLSGAAQPTQDAPVPGAAQERLSALVTFSRRLFGQTDPAAILETTCDAARDILLAQVAQLVITTDEGARETTTSSGLSGDEMERLLGSRMCRDLQQALESGGSALFPMSPDEVDCGCERAPAWRFCFDAGGADRVGGQVVRLSVRAESHRPAEFHRGRSGSGARYRGPGRGGL